MTREEKIALITLTQVESERRRLDHLDKLMYLIDAVIDRVEPKRSLNEQIWHGDGA